MDDKDKGFRGEMVGNAGQVTGEGSAEGLTHGENLSSFDSDSSTVGGGSSVVDDDLPGFKVHYNGNEPEDAGFAAPEGGVGEVEGGSVAADGSVVESGSASDGSSVAVGNGAVAHGEGEIKSVMLNNESVGGLSETTLKTAPVSPEGQFASAGNVGGVASADASGTDGNGLGEADGGGFDKGGEKQGITEAEARAMLIEDNARAKENLKKANAKGRKTLMVVIILAVVLIIAGVVVSVILGGRDKDDKQEGNEGENVAVVEEPEEEDELEEELVELSLDDEVVKRAYEGFSHVESAWDDGMLFYVEALRGGLSRNQIMKMAFYRLQAERFASDDGSGTVNYCRGEHPMVGSEEWLATDCYSGEEMRNEIKKLFGIDDFAFVEGDEAATACRFPYDAENDEFYQTKWCGGAASAFLIRKLYKAEKDENRLYLYEKAVFWTTRAGEEEGFYKLGDDGWNVLIEGLVWNELGLEQVAEVIDDPRGDELFDRFKWTFRLDEEGNYVFEGLERAN